MFLERTSAKTCQQCGKLITTKGSSKVENKLSQISSVANVTAQTLSGNPASLIKLGLKGTQRNLEYLKIHKKPHPLPLIFGPLGGLFISDKDLQQETKTKNKSILPSSPKDGPPLPAVFGVPWPWSKER